MQDDVTVSVTEDDGNDDDDGTVEVTTTTTSTTTTTAKPKTTYRNRYRGGSGGGGDGDNTAFKKYAVRAVKVVPLKAVEEHRLKQQRRRTGVVEVECRLRVPGDGTGGGRWEADRPADRYYGVRKSVAYKYRGGGGGQQPSSSGDAYAAVSSASSADDADNVSRAETAGSGSADRPFVRSACLLFTAAVALR